MVIPVEQNSTPDEAVSPVAPGALLSLLRAHVPSLSHGPAQVGRTVLEDPRAVVPMTVQQLADHAGTSEASVIRLTKAIGCSGYREFRTLLTATVAQAGQATSDGGLPADITVDDGPSTVVAKLLAEERQALTDTAAAVSTTALTAAADAVVTARRVIIVGIGASGLVAEDLAAKLERIGLGARAVTEGHHAMTLAVLMTPDDLLIAISASGETTDVVEPLAAAQRSGVPSVAITVRPRSSLTSADHVLVGVAAREGAMRSAAMSSRTGQLFVVDALFTLVFQRRADEASAAISTSHHELVQRRHGKDAR
ncbi:MAG: MurR/RpiR family transcriptional regulator [Janibacter sp.]